MMNPLSGVYFLFFEQNPSPVIALNLKIIIIPEKAVSDIIC